jgi:hypothetical protein
MNQASNDDLTPVQGKNEMVPVRVTSAHQHIPRFSIHEAIFIGIMAVLNVVVDLLASTILKFFLPQVIVGVFIMVPVNFMLMTTTRFIIDKPGVLIIYLATFGALSIPTPLFGGVAGPYKIVVGLAIGALLDFAYSWKNIAVKLVSGAVAGSIAWWVATYTVWQAFGLPFVTGFSNMFNAASIAFNGGIDLSPILHLPINGFSMDFFAFAVLCGFFSSGPVLIGNIAGYKLYKVIQSSPQLVRFRNMK